MKVDLRKNYELTKLVCSKDIFKYKREDKTKKYAC